MPGSSPASPISPLPGAWPIGGARVGDEASIGRCVAVNRESAKPVRMCLEIPVRPALAPAAAMAFAGDGDLDLMLEALPAHHVVAAAIVDAKGQLRRGIGKAVRLSGRGRQGQADALLAILAGIGELPAVDHQRPARLLPARLIAL